MMIYTIIEDISKFVNDGLTFNLLHICIQILATLILFFVVKKFLWKPIHNILEKRRELSSGELAEARRKNEEAQKREEEAAKILEAARAESRSIVEKAVKQGQAEKERLITEAKEEAKRRMDNLELELEQTVKDSEAEIRQQIVDIAFQTAEKILGKEIDHEKNLEFVNHFIEEVGK